MASLDDSEESRLDLVPMIDTIMLLLLFFILTTKFSAEEKVISSLLPTDKGQGPGVSTVEKPEEINVIITPLGFAPGEKGVEAMDTRWKSNPVSKDANLRITGSPAIFVMDGKLLEERPSPRQQKHLEEIHAFVAEGLKRSETPAGATDRRKLAGVIINCFSGLDYKYALVAYDSVRGYEGQFSGTKLNNLDLQKAREVSFCPPRIRNYHAWELGNELYEMMNLK